MVLTIRCILFPLHIHIFCVLFKFPFPDCIFKTEVFFSVPVLFKSDPVKTLLANISQGTKSVLAACGVRRSEDGSGSGLRVHQ